MALWQSLSQGHWKFIFQELKSETNGWQVQRYMSSINGFNLHLKDVLFTSAFRLHEQNNLFIFMEAND